jgi:CIC family chloride channel protein
VVFTKVLYAFEDLADKVWRGPEWLRPAVGGVVLGLLLVALPQMYGVGYPVLNNAVIGRYAAAFLVLLMVGKIVATSLTISIGGSGGVFAPSLFIGAMLGAAFGNVVQLVVPGHAGPVGAYALIGMGAVFAGAARAPITAVVIMFELTGEYSIILPLMAAIVLATGISHQLSADTIYTLKLRRRGVDLSSPVPSAMTGLTALAAMGSVPHELRTDQSLQAAAAALSEVPDGVLPVVDVSGRYVGILTATAVTDALGQEERADESVEGLVEVAETVWESTSLYDAAEALDRATGIGLPVLDRTSGQVTGWLTSPGVLRAIRSAGTPPARS